MKRRIYWSLCMVALAAMVMSAAASLFAFYGFYEKQVRTLVQDECRLILSGMQTASKMHSLPNAEQMSERYLTYLSELYVSEKNLRATLVTEGGVVLFDSEADETAMSNHGERPEIASAVRTGFGEDVRHSDTLNKNTYYCAFRLENGMILRIAQDQSSITAILPRILPIVLIIALGVFAACLFIARMVTGRIVRPLTAAGDNLENLEGVSAYDELAPFLSTISSQNKLIKEQLDTLKDERETIDLIMDNMQEGLVLIGKGKKILSVNRSASDFLGRSSKENFGESIITLTRNAELLSAVDQALTGTPASGIIRTGGEEDWRDCQYFASPVWSDEALTGVILFLLDVTRQLKAQKVREEFSANVSHELRTPLTSISGFAEIMKNGMVLQESEITKFSTLIYSEAQRLLALVDDIMRLSQIEECRNELPSVKVNLYTLSRGICTNMKPVADKRGIRISAEGENLIVNGNLSMLHEMIANLVDNAIKYNLSGGEVKVSVHEENGKVALTVADSGIGIPKEHQERIFERFYRVDKSRSKQTGGTGLGLSIVKHIVEYHKGEISLESSEGNGTTIRVVL